MIPSILLGPLMAITKPLLGGVCPQLIEPLLTVIERHADDMTI